MLWYYGIARVSASTLYEPVGSHMTLVLALCFSTMPNWLISQKSTTLLKKSWWNKRPKEAPISALPPYPHGDCSRDRASAESHPHRSTRTWAPTAWVRSFLLFTRNRIQFPLMCDASLGLQRRNSAGSRSKWIHQKDLKNNWPVKG